MTGSLLELVAKGIEDIFLIGNPQITLFIAVYRRISNFSMYDHIFDLKGADFNKDFKLEIDRMGDLLHKLSLVVDIPEIQLERTKATFEYISSLLISYGIDWNYHPESKSAIVTLNNYNGGSVELSSDKINTNIFYEGDLKINLTTGKINFGTNNSNSVKVVSGELFLSAEISDNFNNNFPPLQTILTVPVNVVSGTLKLMTNSIFGDVFPIKNGTVKLNKQKVGSSYVYFISDISLTSEFSNTILKSINQKILHLIENYNLYANAKIITRNSDYFINQSTNIFDNLDPNNPNDQPSQKSLDIQSSLISGRNIFMHFIESISTKYASEYSYNTPTYFFPKSNNDFIVQNTLNGLTKITQLYSENFKDILSSYGLLAGAIKNYSYDSLAYNSNYKYKSIKLLSSNGNLLTSDDNTNIFITKNITQNELTSIWMSENGEHLTITDEYGNIYVSSDSAQNFTSTILSPYYLSRVVGSSNGNIQMAISNNLTNGYIYITYNHWTSNIETSISLTNSDYIKDILVSDDINIATIVTYNGLVYTYDGTTNWILKTTLPMLSSSNIVGCGGSSDGEYQTILSSRGRVYSTTNEWTSYIIKDINIDSNLTSLSVSNNGNYQIISDETGNIYLSSSYGSTWSNPNNITPNKLISVYIGTNDGKQQIAVDENGNLYISDYYGIRWSNSINTGTNYIISGVFKYLNTQDSVLIKSTNTQSIPLFENNLTKPLPDLDLVKFNLYNSDDIRMLMYVTFINNILRQKIVLTQNEIVEFNPIYSTTLKNSDIPISTFNIKTLDPDNTSLEDSLLFYHLIDPRITSYNVFSHNIGTNTDTYFNTNINKSYELYDKYNTIIGGRRVDYKITDAYKVYKSFIKDVMNGDIVNKFIKSPQQVDLLATTLRYNTDLNIRYNINQVLNNMTILSNATRTNSKHFILTFYRQFTQSLDTYTSTSGLAFVPIIDSDSSNLADNFKNLLNTLIQIPVPDGVTITNYFGDYINLQIKNFTIACQNLLKGTNYDQYISDYTLWARALATSGSSMLTAYNLVNLANLDFPTIPSTVFGRISLMNFIPLLVAKDIPVMMYDTFVKYGKQMMIDIGFDSESDQSNYNNFLNLIDFRDNDAFDRSTPLPSSIPSNVVDTKLEIYTRIVQSLILTSYDGGVTQTIDNGGHYQQLQFEKATGQVFVLACSLRPDTFFCSHSIVNDDGSLTDISNDPVDLKSLPIEWLTQTYYHMFKNKIINFINNIIPNTNSVQNKTAKKILLGTLQNIINCFILRNDMPLYSNYKNNNYSLLGLVDETESTIKKYKKIKEQITITTPKYSDAISSIWYQTQKGMIQLYNKLFNDTLLSSKYFYNNLGNTMGSIFDYIKSQMIDSDNIYYDIDNNKYPVSLPDSLLESFVDIYKNDFSPVPIASIDYPTSDVVDKILNFVGEIYPYVDTKSASSISTNQGFNFFRLNVGNPNVITSKAYKINTYVKDHLILYNHLINFYESHKNITLIKNDIDTLNFTTPTPGISGIKRKNTFQFEQSSILISLINEHIQINYINPVINKDIRDSLILLNNNTSAYWNPSVFSGNTFVRTNPTGVYNILDVIYNQNFVGSLHNLITKMSYIPSGLSIDDPIDFSQNPFSSYCLHIWFDNLKKNYAPPLNQSEFTYRHLKNATDLLKTKLYTIDGIDMIQNITTQTIIKNKFISKLYTDNNKNQFPSVEYVAWYVFDLMLSDTILDSYTKFSDLFSSIQKTTSVKFDNALFSNSTTLINLNTDNGAIETLQNLLVNHINPKLNLNISNFQSISQFKNNFELKYNNLNIFFNVNMDDSLNDDISYYKQSFDGNPKINVPLEIRLFNLISGKKPKYAWVKELGHKIAKKISISIGGQVIDSYTPELMHLVYNLNKSEGHTRGHNILIGNIPEMYTYSNKKRESMKLIIPFYFWFCKNAGSSLPLSGLLHTDIVVSGQISNLNELLYIEPDTFFKRPPKLKCGLMGRFIYVEDDERSLIAETKMEYLLEKFNYNGLKTFNRENLFKTGANLISDTNENIDITNLTPTAEIEIKINDPIKYFVWYFKFRDKTTELPIDVLSWCDFGYNVRNMDSQIISIDTVVQSIELKMNGITRESPHPESYFTYLVPYEKKMGNLNKGEYVYSFALYPLLLQPTGAANYSEIPSSSLVIKFTPQIEQLFKNNPNLELVSELWGLAYNNLRCVSGMAGLVFNKP